MVPWRNPASFGRTAEPAELAIDQPVESNPFFASDLQWPRVDIAQCVAALEMCRHLTVRSAIDIRLNALMGKGVKMSGTPHLDSLEESLLEDYCSEWEDFGRESLVRCFALGFVPWTWISHPTYKKVPSYLDIAQLEIRFLRTVDRRVIYHLYDTSTQVKTMVDGQLRVQPRRLWDAYVYEVDPPDITGRINSKMISLLPEYQYYMEVRRHSRAATQQMAYPQVIVEDMPKVHSDDAITSASDMAALDRQVQQASGMVPGGGHPAGGMDNGRAVVDPFVRRLHSYLNNVPSDVANALQNPEVLEDLKRAHQRQNSVMEIDHGKVLVTNKMTVAQPPPNVQEVEIAFLQKVYEALSIPRTMVTSEGSKTSTNENAQRVFDDAQIQSIRFLKKFLPKVYNCMHKNDDMKAYWQAKEHQYNEMKKLTKQQYKFRKMAKRREEEQWNGYGYGYYVIDNKENDDDDYDDDDDEEEEYDEEWDETEAKFDAYFAATCTQQEAIAKTKLDITITPTRPTLSISTDYSMGFLNWEGARQMYIDTTGVPDEYVPTEATMNPEQLAGTMKPTDPNLDPSTSGPDKKKQKRETNVSNRQ